jgi:hypothetical protein
MPIGKPLRSAKENNSGVGMNPCPIINIITPFSPKTLKINPKIYLAANENFGWHFWDE